MSTTKDGSTRRVHPDGKLLHALDAWIDRHAPLHMQREETVRQVLAGRLAGDRPSTQLPGFTTGRDLV